MTACRPYGSTLWLRFVISCVLRCALVAALSGTPARADQTFEPIAGSWSGAGSMKPSDGPSERIRCRVNYVVDSAGQAVKLNLRCASDSYKMDLSANIVQTGTILSGNWFESEYRQGGKISGEHENGVVKAKIESDTITALLTMRTKGNHQLFAMESPGAWISQVSIQLIKDPK
jgi:hypothetical protein